MSDSSGRGQSAGASATESAEYSAQATPLFRDKGAVDEALRLSLRHFSRIEVRGRWFINSHPKSGTHLLRNILFHFNTPQIHRSILFYDTVQAALEKPEPDQIYMGHVPYATYAGCPMRPRSILLARHPGAVALALARAFYDANSTRSDHIYMREHNEFEEIVRKVVCGYECQGQQFGALADSFTEFNLDWLPSIDCLLKFEEIETKLRSDDRALMEHFEPVLGPMFEAMPADTAQRIHAGGAGAISATFSRNATSEYDALRPVDVYRLLPSERGQGLQRIARRLGYIE